MFCGEFITHPNYASNYAQKNGGVVEVWGRDLQQLANAGKVVLAPGSTGTQHHEVLGRSTCASR